jgi:hypothetical protein
MGWRNRLFKEKGMGLFPKGFRRGRKGAREFFSTGEQARQVRSLGGSI